jgi:hypothetical protein
MIATLSNWWNSHRGYTSADGTFKIAISPRMRVKIALGFCYFTDNFCKDIGLPKHLGVAWRSHQYCAVFAAPIPLNYLLRLWKKVAL